MKTLYISTVTSDGHAHNFRMSPRELFLDEGEMVASVKASTFRVSELVDDETVTKMHMLHRQLQGIKTRA